MKILINEDPILKRLNYTEPDQDFQRCWVCGKLCRKGNRKYLSRLESHHIFGKKESDAVLPLCLLCHDLVTPSRSSLNRTEVAFELLKVIFELTEMTTKYRIGEFYYTKLWFLRTIYHSLESKEIK